MISETERKEFKNRLNKTIEKLDNLYESDIVCNIGEHSIIISIDANQIEYFIQSSLRTWLNMINKEIYFETCFELEFNPIRNKVYLEMTEDDFAGSDDIIGNFSFVADTVLNIIDNNL